MLTQGFNLLHLSLPKWFPLFILASVYWSLQCLISALTQEGDGGHFFRLTCSVVLWGGRNTANKYHWRVWGVFAVFQLHWVCSCSQCVYFHGLHFSGSRLLCRELSDVGPGLHALPRSKPLRFRFLGTTQRHSRLGLRFVPFPGPSSSGDQVLGECSRPQLEPATYRLLRPFRSVFWVYNRRAFSGVPYVSSGELMSGCDPPGRCRLSRIPRSLG